MVGASLGGMVCAPLIELMFREYGYCGTMMVASGLMLHYCVAGALYRPLGPIRFPHSKTSRGETPNQAQQGKLKDNSNNLERLGAEDLDHRKDIKINMGDTSSTKEHSNNQPSDLEVLQIESESETCHLPKNLESGKKKTSHTPVWKVPFPALVNIGHHLGFDMLCNLSFTIFFLLMFGTFLCFGVSQVFLSGLTRELDMTDAELAVMLSVSSAADIPSRILSGIILDLPSVREHRLLAFEIIGVVTGAFAVLLPFCNSHVTVFVTWVIFNLLGSAFHTQHATALSDLVGRPKFTSAMGVCRLFMGIGTIVGPTVGGKCYLHVVYLLVK